MCCCSSAEGMAPAPLAAGYWLPVETSTWILEPPMFV